MFLKLTTLQTGNATWVNMDLVIGFRGIEEGGTRLFSDATETVPPLTVKESARDIAGWLGSVGGQFCPLPTD
jgi:hypothetical protein